ncbi:sensor histidine kinase [Tellurirhabdus rosea]|uniref:sensor histidine kinase n=1 Tax=Tellurirhabdus rosea TaxID=2674997 RepID=UPI002252C2A1|nr:histidine kinase [Tellurirhabdus rosea]
MKSVNSYRIRIIGILVFAILRLGLMAAEILSGEALPLILVIDNTLVAALMIWESSRAVVVYIHRKYPLSALSGRRFGREALLLAVVIALIFFARAMVYRHFYPQDTAPVAFYIFGLFYTYLYAVLAAAFYELLFYMEAWQKANQEAEQLKKANLMSQLDSLKNQVKPHFLFNSLNTLTALVEKDQAQAVRFIAELSKVYRYLLQSNEKELISLTSELQFAQAYFYLLQTRFGNGISMDIAVDEAYADSQIPPLTVQMLLENAVKHNQVSISKPLRVQISVEDGRWLTIANNIQRKRTSVPGNGMGLSNIAAKYHLLNQPEMHVMDGPDQFVVKVPLLKSGVVI